MRAAESRGCLPNPGRSRETPNAHSISRGPPGHHRRYALDCSKLKTALGWEQCRNFTEGLASTIQWYQENGPWLECVHSQTYRDYYDRHYLHRELLIAGIKSA